MNSSRENSYFLISMYIIGKINYFKHFVVDFFTRLLKIKSYASLSNNSIILWLYPCQKYPGLQKGKINKTIHR